MNQLNFNTSIAASAQAANRWLKINEGDYWKDGALYCGVCNEIKANRYFGDVLTHASCLCEQEKDRKRETAKKAEELRGRIEDKTLLRHTFKEDDRRYDLSAAYDYVQNWDCNQANNIGLMFAGNMGVGKSFAASCIANALLDKAMGVQIFTMKQLTDVFGALGTHENRRSYEIKLRNAELFIIDEFGFARSTEHYIEACHEIIDIRYNAKKPLIVTTNLSLEEMVSEKNQSKARIYDRIKAMCSPVVIEGESRRKEEAREKAGKQK